MNVELYNPNPSKAHPVKAGDCMIRAICKVTGYSWYDVYDRLCIYGRKFGMMPNQSFVAYMAYKDIFDTGRIYDGIKLKEFIEFHPSGKYILFYGKHAVALVDGVIYDDPIKNYEKDMDYQIHRYFKVKDGEERID